MTIETRAADRHVVTAEAIAAAHAQQPLDGVLLMSPANPTGTMMTDEALRDIAHLCRRLGLRFVSDEIYHGLTYERPAQTALAFSDEVVVVNSFSKYYCMTGWRIGWLVLPRALAPTIERLAQSFAISAPTVSQVAAEAAFDGVEELEAVKASYARSRAMLAQELPRIGLGEYSPVDGAFYVYVDVSRLTNDSTRVLPAHAARGRRRGDARASTSIASGARSMCASRSRGRRATCAKGLPVLAHGCRRYEREGART